MIILLESQVIKSDMATSGLCTIKIDVTGCANLFCNIIVYTSEGTLELSPEYLLESSCFAA